MKRIKVLFFALLKDRIGTNQLTLDLPDTATVRDLKSLLSEQYPGSAPILGRVLASINREFAFDEDLLPPESEIGLFPPVSGGQELPTIVQVTEEIIDIDRLVAQITLPSSGAACIFSGMVRGMTRRGNPHETVCLEYEAYTPMAEAKMRQVADEIRAQWPTVEGIAIVQRVGRLDPMTPTVLIACTAAHRDTGVFDAARYGIDRLKEIVPVWKKEIGPNGEEWIEGEYQPTHED